MRSARFLGVSSLLFLVLACGSNEPVPGNPDPGAAGRAGGTPGGTAGQLAGGAGAGNEAGTPGGGAAGRPQGDAGGPVAQGGRAGGNVTPAPGDRVDVAAPQALTAERAALDAQLEGVSKLTSAELLQQTRVPFRAAPTYDTQAADAIAGLATIQGSSLRLNEAELAKLGEQGFVVTDRKRFPTFVYGYETLYLEDLPLYVSADSILFAVHRSYDKLLTQLERAVLIDDLTALLNGMRGELEAATDVPAKTRADADVYLSVAASLVSGSLVQPTAGGSANTVQKLVGLARANAGIAVVELFGTKREEDFSQFKPRGHYNDGAELARYFQAMMWLGRTDFRLLETQTDGSQIFRRSQLEAALLLRDLLKPGIRERFDRIDKVVTAFVGEHDYMQVSELESLLKDLGVSASAELAPIADQRIAQAIVDGGYGTQRISSHIMINDHAPGTLPLSSSFAFLGQRYVLDSHVFSNVVYDRVNEAQVYRMMPNPLDVAYAALGNNHAVQLLAPELEKYPYAPELASMRVLAEAHGSEFWNANLYNLWLGAVGTLSPKADDISKDASGLPPVARSEAWGRRLLNTQLASWAELRHDTLLYAKQSYTAGAACEFPDAYVDPYPEFYRAVAHYASRGASLVQELAIPSGNYLGKAVDAHFEKLGEVATRLGEMADHQRTGAPYTAEMLAFINDAVVIQQGCGSPAGFQGWYAQLFLDNLDATEFDPTMADVHTQPTDEGGAPVGHVLHVATGMPRLMVVVSETCSGPRAYAGLASSYFERVTKDFERLQDETWAAEIGTAHPADPAWLGGIVVR